MGKKNLLIMGVFNTTPDSFFDGGRYTYLQQAVERAYSIESAGGDILDVGGESTRPGSEEVSPEEEKRRVLPLLKELQGSFSLPISIDTRHAEIAEEAIKLGASWINDISGFRCEKMRKIGVESGANLVIMHMQGDPKTMQKSPHYPHGVMMDVVDWLKKQVNLLLDLGAREDKIVLDPGIGFGKTVEDNLVIFKTLDEVKNLGFPVLIGASRKSFLAKILDVPKEDLLAATLAAHFYRYPKGADIVRVHDVKEHVYMRKIMEALS